jgi:hypothetical protein
MTDEKTDDDWEVVPGAEVLRRHGSHLPKPPVLDPSKVPVPLHALIPWVERFGVSDDVVRETLLDQANEEERSNARSAFAAHEAALMDWLAGPEANERPLSREYIAFSALWSSLS